MTKLVSAVNNGIYQADLELGMLESIASNAKIKAKLEKLGFIQVEVTGKGRKRTAIGRWVGNDITVEMPKQVKNVKQL